MAREQHFSKAVFQYFIKVSLESASTLLFQVSSLFWMFLQMHVAFLNIKDWHSVRLNCVTVFQNQQIIAAKENLPEDALSCF